MTPRKRAARQGPTTLHVLKLLRDGACTWRQGNTAYLLGLAAWVPFKGWRLTEAGRAALREAGQ